MDINEIYYTKCRLCNRKIKQQGARVLIHRSCWLKYRDFNNRRFDFLFCKEKYKGNNFSFIKPT